MNPTFWQVKKEVLMKILSGRSFQTACLAALLLLLTPQAYGGGLYIYEMANPADVGTAGAGLAAKAQDASTVYANPAGMTRIKTPEVFAGATFMYLHSPFDSDSSTTVSGPDGDTSEVFGGGNFAYVHPLGEDWAVGVSMQNFFGLSLKWGDNWVGRYQSTEEWLIAPQVQPTVAYRVNDWFSIGAGAALTVGYLKAEGEIYDPGTGDDGSFNYSDTDFAVQGNFGLMIEPNEDTRIGIRYLSQTKLEFNNDISLHGVNPALKQGVRNLGDLEIDIYIPQSLNVSGFYQINKDWAILGSVGWEDWSRFGRLQIGFSSTGEDNLDIKAKDAYHFGIGGQYQWNSDLLISFGFSFDSEMFEDSDRPINLHMGDMYRYGTGFTYDLHENFTIGAALEVMWEGDLPVKPSSSAGGDVSGEYSDVWFIFPSIYGIWRF